MSTLNSSDYSILNGMTINPGTPERFVTWLNDVMREENLSRNELAKRSGISHTTINKIMNYERNVTFRVAKALAKGL